MAGVLSAPVKMLSAITGQQEAQSAGPAPSPIIPLIGRSGSDPKGNEVVLVTGATGGVGKRVVAQLLSQGKKVRALVRDVKKAKELLVSNGSRVALFGWLML